MSDNRRSRAWARWMLSVVVLAPVALVAPPASAGTTGVTADTSGNLLANASFEEVGPDGLPASWSPLWPGSEKYYSLDDTDASDGGRSLRVRDASTTAGAGLRPVRVPVTGGVNYTFSMDLKLTSGVLQPTVYFYDSAGARIAQPYQVLRPAPGAWDRQAATFPAPADAVSAEPVIYSSSVGTADGLVDSVAFAATGPAPQPPAGVEQDLGEPIAGITNAGAGYTTDSAGRDIGVVIGGGSPSTFSAVDIVTGARLMSRTMPNVIMSWSFVTTADRDIYIGTQTKGEVWRFDPDDLTLELVATAPFGQTHLWSATLDDRGRPVWGTYPDGKVIAYDPATGQWQDYGVQVEGNIYVRSIDSDGRYVYAGGGALRASLTRLDTHTGEVHEIPLPAGHDADTFLYDVTVSGGLLFARPTPSTDLLVYSLAEQAWVDVVPQVVGLAVSPEVSTEDSGVRRREALIVPIEGAVIAYDLDTRQQRRISMNLQGSAARGWALMELGTDGFPGTSVVTATSKSIFHAWNPATGRTAAVRADAELTPFLIRSMATGPRGDVYVGGYGSPPGIARVDVDSGATEPLNGVGQTEGLVAHGDHLVFGTYPGARIYAYDTTRPWDPATNPVTDRDRVVSLGSHQDRPLGWASAGDVVAIGSMPDYGQLGGALSLFNPSTGDLRVFRDVVKDQTPLALAYRDGLVYGGTGIWGGIGIEPTTSEGKLFVFDPATGKVVFETVPVPGEENVSALTFDDDGNLWGFTANALFKFDPDTRRVVFRKTYFGVDDSKIYATGRELFWHHGKLVGTSTGRLFEIDPATLQMTILQTGMQNLAIDRNGSYYYNRGSTLYRWVPEPVAPACDRTITGTHHGDLAVEAGTTCVRNADVRGGIVVRPGAGVLVEDSQVQGGVETDHGRAVWLRRSQVHGAVSVAGTGGWVVLSGNRISGSLTCTGNDSEPTDRGAPNSVTGDSLGQCAGM
ncbi:hypothetical protein ACGF5C_22170 [Micromonospora sp. NPDC047620]|uniref:hypothetical protein n=1 Tax=Micromonospora sp. NPDC047620 TaxID=3364251 RepID=UPI0037101FB3